MICISNFVTQAIKTGINLKIIVKLCYTKITNYRCFFFFCKIIKKQIVKTCLTILEMNTNKNIAKFHNLTSSLKKYLLYLYVLYIYFNLPNLLSIELTTVCCFMVCIMLHFLFCYMPQTSIRQFMWRDGDTICISLPASYPLNHNTTYHHFPYSCRTSAMLYWLRVQISTVFWFGR